MAGTDLGENLVAMFQERAARGGERPLLWAKLQGTWQAWSWARVEREVAHLARWLAAAGIAPGDRVLIVAENRPEWCIANLAVLTAGAVAVPAYPTNTVDDHRFILEHSEATGVIFSTSVTDRLLPAIAGATRVRALLGMDGVAGDGAAAGSLPVEVVPWGGALERGAAAPPVDVGRRSRPDDLACFIYTSGTGGRPKGVMLSHANIGANIRGITALTDRLGFKEEIFLSFLPLSHTYEHTAGQFWPLSMGAQIYYAEGVEKLSANLMEVRPTVVTCVPRLFEALKQRITAGVERQGGWRKRLFEEAVALGRRRLEAGSLPPHLALADRALDRLVRAKVKARFGGRMKAFVSGGAPLNPEVGRFFLALGLPLLQGYGQTESSPVISVNPPSRNKIDTVGPPLEGVELKIADDGEILVRGDLVMRGYWKDPEATAETLRDGWLHTGDVGRLDADGYLKITDRKRDIIVNSGGDNIAPQRVEGALALEPELGQVLVFGDRRPHLVALIVPSADFVKSFASGAGREANAAALAADPGFQEAIGAAVRRANGTLSPIERVRRFHIVAEPFTIDNGMMTPTLKVRRHAVLQAYGDEVAALYG